MSPSRLLYHGPVDPAHIQLLLSNGQAEAALAWTSGGLIHFPSAEVFALWVTVQSIVSDAHRVLVAARHIHQGRHGDLWGACCLAVALAAVGRFVEARQVLADCAAANVSESFTLLLAQFKAAAEGKPKRQLLNRLSRTRRWKTELLVEQAVRELGMGQYLACQTKLARALTLNPDCYSARFVRAFLYFLGECMGDQKTFLEDRQVLHRLAPSHAHTRAVDALDAIDRGDFVRAKSELSHVLNDLRIKGDVPLTAMFLVQRALCNAALGDTEAADADLAASLVSDPQNLWARLIRAHQLLEAGLLPEALWVYNAVLAAHPDQVEALVGRGWCWLRLGRFRSEAQDFKAAWRLEPTDPHVKAGATFGCILEVLCGQPQLPPNLYLWPSIPQNKLDAVRQSYVALHQLQPSSQILLLYDATVGDGACQGLCLTEDAVYWIGPSEGQGYWCKYADIQSVQTGNACLQIDGIASVAAAVVSDHCLPLLAQLLGQLKELHHRYGPA